MISIRFFHSIKVTAYTLLICIIAYSCNSRGNKNETVKNEDSAGTQVAIKPTTSLNQAQHILTSNITPHFFTNHSQKDTFKLILIGDSLYNATAIFSIISYKGERIYVDTFLSSDLFNKSDIRGAGIANIDDSIKYRVKAFFENSTAFIDTVTGGNPVDDEIQSDTVFMKEIDSDQSIIGFQYSIGVECYQCIAYSKKQHKVLVYAGINSDVPVNNSN